MKSEIIYVTKKSDLVETDLTQLWDEEKAPHNTNIQGLNGTLAIN